MTDSAWKVAPGRNRRHRAPLCSSVPPLDDVDPDDLERRVSRALLELLRSDFCRASLDSIRTVLNKPPRLLPTAILCYGLGSLSNNHSSVHQLAMLQIIRRFVASDLSVEATLSALSMTSLPPCHAFDPAFARSDVIVLKRFGITFIGKDEQCVRPLAQPTLLFMPHCDMWMYNNILWANWSYERLAQVALLGNSFDLMRERTLNRRMKKEYKFIFLVGHWDVHHERHLPCWEDNDFVFNDTVIARFRFNDHNRASIAACPRGLTPVYDVALT